MIWVVVGLAIAVVLIPIILTTYMLAVPVKAELNVTPINNDVSNLSMTELDDVDVTGDLSSLDALVYDADNDVFVPSVVLATDPDVAIGIEDLLAVNANIRVEDFDGRRYGNLVTLSFRYSSLVGNLTAGQAFFTLPDGWAPTVNTGLTVIGDSSNEYITYTFIDTDGVVSSPTRDLVGSYGAIAGIITYISPK